MEVLPRFVVDIASLNVEWGYSIVVRRMQNTDSERPRLLAYLPEFCSNVIIFALRFSDEIQSANSQETVLTSTFYRN